MLSPPTSRKVVERGVRLSPSELCLPAKAFLGHVAEMKDKVDAIFLPRIVCTRVAREWFFGCPKTIALPDLTRAVFDSLPAVIEPVLDGRVRTDAESYRAAVSGTIRTADIRSAYMRAGVAAQAATQRTSEQGSPLHMFSEQGTAASEIAHGKDTVKIGVVGHSYLLYDSGLSLGVLDKVKETGARPVTVFPKTDEIEKEARRETTLNWYYELELLTAARHLLEVQKVDGMLLVASFACGTGAVTNELIQREAVHRHGVPTILVLLDEHTGEAGLTTRIESFVDLLRLRKR